MRIRFAISVALTTFGVGGPALAQEGLEQVEPGISDVEPRAAGLRSLRVDLRSTSGFETLYHGPWIDPELGTRDVFTRTSGAVSAVFPRSSYVETSEGTVPEVPAGTIFYIGSPQAQQSLPEAPENRPGRYNLLRDLSSGPISQTWHRGQAMLDFDADLSIWSDEEYRQIRVSRLLNSIEPAEPDEESDDF